MSSELLYHNSLDRSIFNSRLSGSFLLLLYIIEIPACNANIIDRDRRRVLRQFIWVCNVCQLSFVGFPTKIGLGEFIHFQGSLPYSLYLPSEKESYRTGKNGHLR